MTEKTIRALMHDHIAAFSASNRPAEIISANVEKMFADIIKDAFSSYSDMGKLVKEAIKQALPSNVEGLFELTRYNDLIATAMKAQWESSGVTGEMLRRSKAAIDEALKEDIVPAVVKLSDLLNAFIEDNKERATDERWERPHISIRESDNSYSSSVKHMHICFDPKPEELGTTARYSLSGKRSEWELANRISVSIKGQDELGHDYGDVYSAQLDGSPIGRNFMIYSKWEKLTAALYFGGANLVIDCDEHDFSYDLYD